MTMTDERFICHILTIAAVAAVIGYMAWKGGRL
jgi:hypothetical protein